MENAGGNRVFTGVRDFFKESFTSPLYLWTYLARLAVYACMPLTGFLIFFVTVAEALWRQRVAGDNPWGVGATTLEWTLSSPPPFHSFETLPRFNEKRAE